MWHFIWVLTVCESTSFGGGDGGGGGGGGFGLQRVKTLQIIYLSILSNW